jgi:LPS sulfotransferase NodH
MWPYFDCVVQMLQEIPAYRNLNAPQLFAAVFNRPKYIWLRRRNRVQQAVSWAIAEQTGVWIQKAGEKLQMGATPRFDFDVIDHLYNLVVASEAGWANYFRESHIEPLVLFYEDVVASNRDAVRRILEFLGVPFAHAFEIAPPTVQKQGTQMSEEWTAAYLKLKKNKIGKLARRAVIKRMTPKIVLGLYRHVRYGGVRSAPARSGKARREAREDLSPHARRVWDLLLHRRDR